MHRKGPAAGRSEETKAAILSAARAEFARVGYQGATIRGIAAVAAIDPALVIRYFGSKEQLFARAAEFDLKLPDLREVPREAVGQSLAAHFFDRWENDEALLALLRAAAGSEAAAERMRLLFVTQLLPALSKLTGERRADVASRAGLIATQVLGLALCRYVLQLPPVVALRRADVVRHLGPTLQAYLYPAAGS